MSMVLKAWVKPKPVRQILTESSETKTALFLRGMEFERWIDTVSGSARSNGLNEGGLIENPAYVVESILRDWVFAERNLRVDVPESKTEFEISGSVYGASLSSSKADYYVGAIWYNHNTGHKSYVTSYDGSTKIVTIADDDPGTLLAGMYVTLTNIQGDNLIDITSFDSIGNTTNGLRKDYVAAKSLNEFSNAKDYLQSVCSDFLLFLTKSGGKYKLATLEAKSTADGTFSNPLKENGREKIFTYLTDLNSIYTDFKFQHNFNYAKSEYTDKMVCNALGSTYGLGTTYEGYCRTIQNELRQGIKSYEKDFQFIHNGMDSEPATGQTMHLVAQKLIEFYTKQRLAVEYYGDFKNHMVYEPGDQVKINYPSQIPNGLNNSAFFLITEKQIENINGIPIIRFGLLQTF